MEQISIKQTPGIECLRAHHLNTQFSRHSHNTYVIGVIEAGNAGTFYRGSTRYLAPGSIMVLNPGEVHSGYETNHGTLSYSLFYIEPETIQALLPENSGQPHFLDIHIHDPHWARQLQMLHAAVLNGAECLAEQELFIRYLGGFTRQFGWKNPLEVDPVGSETAAIRTIKEYLHANYQRVVNIDELAALVNLHRDYLIRAFSRAVGMPPYAYLLQVRIDKAKQRLMDGAPLADVALELGFADQSHFTRHFKRIVGTSPRQYVIGHYRSRNFRAPD
ncbi:MAG TPA: AraC family transcriptional regulator [Aggregatilineaceae bacterium]|nr:AraC family transcriptional regulator [Aggregatilineaceae bacterium]